MFLVRESNVHLLRGTQSQAWALDHVYCNLKSASPMTLKALVRIPFSPAFYTVVYYFLYDPEQLKKKFSHIHLPHIFHFAILLFINTFTSHASQVLTPAFCHPPKCPICFDFSVIQSFSLLYLSFLLEPLHFCKVELTSYNWVKP